MAAGTYLVASFVLALLSIVGFIIRWEGLAEWAAYGLGVTLICGELARIAGRVGPPAQGDISVSVLDATQQFRREHFRQRVALLSIMASAQDQEVRIRAKRELDWADVELFGRVAPEVVE